MVNIQLKLQQIIKGCKGIKQISLVSPMGFYTTQKRKSNLLLPIFVMHMWYEIYATITFSIFS